MVKEMTRLNQIGYEKTMDLCKKLENKEISFVEFIDEFEIIAFNDFSSKSFDNFNDGWSKGGLLRLMKLFLQASSGDKKAEDRLLVDLDIEYSNIGIKKM